MNAARVLSGEYTALRSGSRRGAALQRVAGRSQVQRRVRASNPTDLPSGARSNWLNGRWNASSVVSAARERAAARAAWSKARARVRFAGSTSTNSKPCGIATRYQNRPLASHVGRTPVPNTSGVVL